MRFYESKSYMPAKVHFPGLNGLRFFAAFVVIIHNLEQTRYLFGYKNYWDYSFFRNIGNAGVVLFFVLSGFLITYLLLREKTTFNKISVWDFYVRRILKIWPLYFLFVIWGLFIAPSIAFFNIPQLTEQVHYHFLTKCILFFTILPNTANFMFATIPYLGQAWSIGAEEQFYLIWPWVIKFTRQYIKVFLFFVVGFISLTGLFVFLAGTVHITNPHSVIYKLISFAYGYFKQVRIGCMAIGGTGAYLVFSANRLLRFIYSYTVQIITWLVTAGLCITGMEFPVANYEIYAILFCIIILNVATNDHSIFKLENQPLDFLGRISYGLYMYHQLATVIVLKLLVMWYGFNFTSTMEEGVLYLSTIVLTITLSSLSYFYFELPFLRIKNRFEKIKSSNHLVPSFAA